jgi:hypothetical protein
VRDRVVEVVGAPYKLNLGRLGMFQSPGHLDTFALLTQRSSLPSKFMLEPAGTAAPRYFHGPCMEEALWIAILPPVEKRKYVPSERRMSEGSWALVQVPEHGSGLA